MGLQLLDHLLHFLDELGSLLLILNFQLGITSELIFPFLLSKYDCLSLDVDLLRFLPFIFFETRLLLSVFDFELCDFLPQLFDGKIKSVYVFLILNRDSE